MDTLPDELLDLVLSFLSPYGELPQCRLVSRRWRCAVVRHCRRLCRHLLRSVHEPSQLCWFHYDLSDWSASSTNRTGGSAVISRRCAHSAVFVDGLLYVFGGCSWRMTTFNDLWTLQPASLRWTRPLAVGSYPSPKAYAGLCAWRRQLLLFGGWSQPAPSLLQQTCRLYDELHMYDIDESRWSRVAAQDECWPPAMAGHGCTVLGDTLVVSGGLQERQQDGRVVASDELWLLHLRQGRWTRPRAVGPGPAPRYGHSQLAIDERRLLVMGGTAGPNKPLRDVWLLRLSDDGEQDATTACWSRLSVENVHHAPSASWSHPACVLGERVLVLSHRHCHATVPPHSQPPPLPPSRQQQQQQQQQRRQVPAGPVSGQLAAARRADACVGRSSRQLCHERRIQQLDRMQARLSQLSAQLAAPHRRQRRRDVLCAGGYHLVPRCGSANNHLSDAAQMRLHVLDISAVLSGGCVVRWLSCAATSASSSSPLPPARKLYSLNVARGELVLFGGVSLSQQPAVDPRSCLFGRGADPHEDTSNSISVLAPATEIFS